MKVEFYQNKRNHNKCLIIKKYENDSHYYIGQYIVNVEYNVIVPCGTKRGGKFRFSKKSLISLLEDYMVLKDAKKIELLALYINGGKK